jgi:hypothetical protein
MSLSPLRHHHKGQAKTLIYGLFFTNESKKPDNTLCKEVTASPHFSIFKKV